MIPKFKGWCGEAPAFASRTFPEFGGPASGSGSQYRGKAGMCLGVGGAYLAAILGLGEGVQKARLAGPQWLCTGPYA